MTRINCGIPPSELTNKHLLAEHREIKRIPNAIKSGRFSLKNQPKEFVLGTGHVKFFYDKLKYLKIRYDQIYLECVKRKFNIKNYSSAWEGISDEYMKDYSPTEKDVEIIRKRIKEKNIAG